MHRQVGPFGEVLPQQAIGVLIGTTLPRASQIAEVNIDVGRQAKPTMIREFLAAVPGQRFVQLTCPISQACRSFPTILCTVEA